MTTTPLTLLITVVLEAGLLGNWLPWLVAKDGERSPQPHQIQKQLSSVASDTIARFDPPDRGTPQGSVDAGGTRGKCPQDALQPNPPLTVLVPRVTPDARDWALTVSPRPTFWVYVPETVASEGLFVLRDRQWNDIYRQQVALPESGILELQLPDTVEELGVEEDYRWQFAVICPPDGTGAPREVVAQGWVRRVEPTPSLIGQLQQQPERDRPLVYGQNGIWYESLSGLARQRQATPDDPQLQQRWQDFLESAGLAEFSEFSLVN